MFLSKIDFGRGTLKTFSFFVFSFFIFSALAYADVPPPTAGSEENRFKQEKFLEEKAPAEASEQAAPVEEKKEAAIPESYKSVIFKLTEVHFSGNESVKTEDLQAIVQPILNRDVNFQDVEEIVSKIKQLYRGRGFVASYIYVPPQNVKSGILTLNVVEGRLGEFQIVGNQYFSTELLRRQFQIQPGDVLSYANFKGDLTTLNKNRDIKARAVLKPGQAAGTTDVALDVEDLWPFHLSADFNNLGTRNTGPYRWGLSSSYDNLFGNMDAISGRFQGGTDVWALSADYSTPINDYGTKLGVGFSHAALSVGGPFRILGIKGNSTTYSPYILQPVVKQENIDVTWRNAFDVKSVENRVLGAVSGNDELRVLSTGLNLEERDSLGQTFSPHSFDFGFSSFLGASDKVNERAIRAGSGGEFAIYRGSIARYHRLPYDMMLSIRGAWQITPDIVPSSEEIRIGGSGSVRGYQEGEYLGDNGGYGTVELFLPLYMIPDDWTLPSTQKTVRKQIQMVGFMDFGGAAIRKPLIGEKPDRFLAGAGAGFRAHLYDKVYGRMEYGFPVGGSTPSDNRSGAFYIGVSYEIF